MKKTLLILAMLLMTLPAFAADLTMTLDFAWDQAAADLPNLAKWGLYVTPTSGGTKPAPIDVPYTSGTGPFLASSAFTVTGTPGTTVRRFFVLDAVSKGGKRSGVSNEVFYDFVIPFADVTVPMTLKVTAKVNP
jgi:hypothetical protein